MSQYIIPLASFFGWGFLYAKYLRKLKPGEYWMVNFIVQAPIFLMFAWGIAEGYAWDLGLSAGVPAYVRWIPGALLSQFPGVAIVTVVWWTFYLWQRRAPINVLFSQTGFTASLLVAMNLPDEIPAYASAGYCCGGLAVVGVLILFFTTVALNALWVMSDVGEPVNVGGEA